MVLTSCYTHVHIYSYELRTIELILHRLLLSSENDYPSKLIACSFMCVRSLFYRENPASYSKQLSMKKFFPFFGRLFTVEIELLLNFLPKIFKWFYIWNRRIFAIPTFAIRKKHNEYAKFDFNSIRVKNLPTFLFVFRHLFFFFFLLLKMKICFSLSASD